MTASMQGPNSCIAFVKHRMSSAAPPNCNHCALNQIKKRQIDLSMLATPLAISAPAPAEWGSACLHLCECRTHHTKQHFGAAPEHKCRTNLTVPTATSSFPVNPSGCILEPAFHSKPFPGQQPKHSTPPQHCQLPWTVLYHRCFQVGNSQSQHPTS